MNNSASTLGLIATLTISCANLSSIPENECGNKVLEEFEDCDSFPDVKRCGPPDDVDRACTYICDLPQIQCPTGWACGLDKRCRLHGGFETVAIRVDDFDSDRLYAGDLDGDKYLDLFGIRENRIKIRFGDLRGEFQEQMSLSTPRPVGLLSHGDFDQDGTSDLLIPVRHGLQMFHRDQSREFCPIPNHPKCHIMPKIDFLGDIGHI